MKSLIFQYTLIGLAETLKALSNLMKKKLPPPLFFLAAPVFADKDLFLKFALPDAWLISQSYHSVVSDKGI